MLEPGEVFINGWGTAGGKVGPRCSDPWFTVLSACPLVLEVQSRSESPCEHFHMGNTFLKMTIVSLNRSCHATKSTCKVIKHQGHYGTWKSQSGSANGWWEAHTKQSAIYSQTLDNLDHQMQDPRESETNCHGSELKHKTVLQTSTRGRWLNKSLSFKKGQKHKGAHQQSKQKNPTKGQGSKILDITKRSTKALQSKEQKKWQGNTVSMGEKHTGSTTRNNEMGR